MQPLSKMCHGINSGLKPFSKIRGNAQSHQLIMQEGEVGREKSGAAERPLGDPGEVLAEQSGNRKDTIFHQRKLSGLLARHRGYATL